MTEDRHGVTDGLRSVAEDRTFVKGRVAELLDRLGVSELTDEVAKEINAVLAAEGLTTKPKLAPGLSPSAKIRIELTSDAIRASMVGSSEPKSINVVGVSAALIGAAITTVAVFVKAVQEPASTIGTPITVYNNSLMQLKDGWIFIGIAALGLVFVALAASRKSWGPTYLTALAGLAIVGVAIYDSTHIQLGLSTYLGESSGETIKAKASTGIYLAGVGGAIMLLSGWLMRVRSFGTTTQAASKSCPDCAETILANARVCKHCGYRFDAEETA